MKKLWLLVTFGFLLLISAWSAMIFIAVNHAPERIAVQAPASP